MICQSKFGRISVICLVLIGLDFLAFGQQLGKIECAIIPYDAKMTRVFPSGSKNAVLSPSEIATAEQQLKLSVDKYNSEQLKRFEELRKKEPTLTKEAFQIDLKQYRRQYVCVIDTNNEKVVWINCIFEKFFSGEAGYSEERVWKESIVKVYDGGKCFFNVKVNLERKTYFDFKVNYPG